MSVVENVLKGTKLPARIGLTGKDTETLASLHCGLAVAVIDGQASSTELQMRRLEFFYQTHLGCLGDDFTAEDAAQGDWRAIQAGFAACNHNPKLAFAFDCVA